MERKQTDEKARKFKRSNPKERVNGVARVENVPALRRTVCGREKVPA
jgi:hypothetical protein